MTTCIITENEELVIEVEGATPEGCMYNALTMYDVATLLFVSYPTNPATLANFVKSFTSHVGLKGMKVAAVE
jgi:hypothetical protein